MHCVVVVVKIGPYYGHFSRIYRSKLSIYLQNYVKNGLIFKTTTQIFFLNTVHNLITFSIVFTNTNRGGGTLSPLPPIITKVNEQWSCGRKTAKSTYKSYKLVKVDNLLP